LGICRIKVIESIDVAISEMAIRILILPTIPVLFAYLEQGGNLYAEKTIGNPTLRNLLVTLFFSVIYSFVAAIVSRSMGVNLALMMINYGFGFSIVSMLLELKWRSVPTFSLQRIKENPRSKWSLIIAVLGFASSAYFVVFTELITP
jgi:hypothetical protein